jgi:Flp pilus assembly protein TadD
MYRSMKDSRYPFSRPSGTGRAAAASIAAAAVVVAIIVACEHDGKTQTTADGAVVTRPAREPVAITPAAAHTTMAPTVPPDVSYATAESAFTARRYPVATEMFSAYTARRPENSWGYYMLGLSAWRAGQLDRAQRAFEGVLALDSGNVKALVNLARVLLEENQATDALARVNAALAVDSGLGEGWRVLGRVQAQLGHTDSAIDAYHQALVIDSSDVWSMNNLGLVLIQAGRFTEAVEPLGHAVQLDSTVAAFSNNLGIALERSGQLDEAAAAYRHALAVDSGYAKARVSLERLKSKGALDPGTGC